MYVGIIFTVVPLLLQGSLSQPQMLVVSDVQDVFVPLLEGCLVKLSESEPMIDMYVFTCTVDACLIAISRSASTSVPRASNKLGD